MKSLAILASLFFIGLSATEVFAECTEKSAVTRCWDACETQNFNDPSLTCASRCGVNTDEGADACWRVCVGQGFSDPSSTCATRCGFGSVKHPFFQLFNNSSKPACGMTGAGCSGPFDCCSGACMYDGCA